jgi:opacity protein-like surface antigen
MRYPSTFKFCLIGILAAGCPLMGQETRFGLQATLAYPTSDLGNSANLDNSLGYGLGANLQFAFPHGHAAVPRMDYTYFEKSSPTRKVQTLLIGADYNYYVSGRVNQGFYFGGGLGFTMAKFEINLSTSTDSDTPNNGYADVAIGYTFDRNNSAELRYVYSKYKPQLFGRESDISSPTVNATYIYRF